MSSSAMVKVVSPRGTLQMMVESAFDNVWSLRGFTLYVAPDKAEVEAAEEGSTAAETGAAVDTGDDKGDGGDTDNPASDSDAVPPAPGLRPGRPISKPE